MYLLAELIAVFTGLIIACLYGIANALMWLGKMICKGAIEFIHAGFEVFIYEPIRDKFTKY